MKQCARRLVYSAECVVLHIVQRRLELPLPGKQGIGGMPVTVRCSEH